MESAAVNRTQDGSLDGAIAVYFGTFDPPHENHMRVAAHAASLSGVQKVHHSYHLYFSSKPLA